VLHLVGHGAADGLLSGARQVTPTAVTIGHRCAREAIAVDGLLIDQETGHELGEVPVPSGCQPAVALEQSVLDLLRRPEIVVPGLDLRLGVGAPHAGLREVVPQQVEQVVALVVGLVEPREMVDAEHVHGDLVARGPGRVEVPLHQPRQQFLSAEYLVATAKDLQPGHDARERARADGHRVGVVDDPGRGAVFGDGLCKALVDDRCTQAAHHAGRPGSVSDGIEQAVALRYGQIGLHGFERTRLDGADDKVGALQRILDLGHRLVGPVRQGFRPFVHPGSEPCVQLGGLQVDVVQVNVPSQIRADSQVGHQFPRPSAAASPKIGDL